MILQLKQQLKQTSIPVRAPLLKRHEEGFQLGIFYFAISALAAVNATSPSPIGCARVEWVGWGKMGSIDCWETVDP